MSIDPRIVAHRGWTRDETENTLRALEAAVSLGCAAVEFDVHATADGIWVMHHDPDLRRLHRLDVRIASVSLVELRAAVDIATLAEALAVLPEGCRPMVEVKETREEHLRTLAADLAGADHLDPLVIVHGDLPSPARAALPHHKIYLFSEDWDEAFARREEPIDGYDLRHDPVPGDRIAAERERFAAAGKEIAVWTVNEPERARKFIEAGVEWVITDHPEWF